MSDLRNSAIIMWSMSRWDGPLSSAAFSIAKELSKTNQVFYLDYPYTVKDYIRQKDEPELKHRKLAIKEGKNIYTKVPGLSDNFTAVTPRGMLSVNFMPEGFIYDTFSGINNKRFFKTIDKIIEDHKLENYILFNSFNPFYGVKIPKRFKPALFVYQSRDDIRAIKVGVKHGVKGERQAIKNADLLLVTSTNLKRVLEQDGGKNVRILPNAAETKLFRTAAEETFEIPKELKGNAMPVVGYIGHVGLRIDFELLEACINRHKDKLFVMIGPGDYEPFTEVDLRSMPNVLFIDSKPLKELPRYLHFMDCTIIPFLKNDLTKSIYPLKMNEQLAAGKAIVCTDFSEDVQGFEDVAYISANKEEFIENIQVAIDSNSEENIKKRMQRSEGNSWKDRIQLFWQMAESVKKTN